MCPVNPQGSLPYLLFGRSDLPQVAVLDTLLPANQTFMLFQSHMVSNGQNTSRPLGMIVQGEGVITQGAAVLICDQIRVQPMRAIMFPSDPLKDNLIDVHFQGDLVCRQWSVVFALAGFGITIRSQLPVWDNVNT